MGDLCQIICVSLNQSAKYDNEQVDIIVGQSVLKVGPCHFGIQAFVKRASVLITVLLQSKFVSIKTIEWNSFFEMHCSLRTMTEMIKFLFIDNFSFNFQGAHLFLLLVVIYRK